MQSERNKLIREIAVVSGSLVAIVGVAFLATLSFQGTQTSPPITQVPQQPKRPFIHILPSSIDGIGLGEPIKNIKHKLYSASQYSPPFGFESFYASNMPNGYAFLFPVKTPPPNPTNGTNSVPYPTLISGDVTQGNTWIMGMPRTPTSIAQNQNISVAEQWQYQPLYIGYFKGVVGSINNWLNISSKISPGNFLKAAIKKYGRPTSSTVNYYSEQDIYEWVWASGDEKMMITATDLTGLDTGYFYKIHLLDTPLAVQFQRASQRKSSSENSQQQKSTSNSLP